MAQLASAPLRATAAPRLPSRAMRATCSGVRPVPNPGNSRGLAVGADCTRLHGDRRDLQRRRRPPPLSAASGPSARQRLVPADHPTSAFDLTSLSARAARATRPSHAGGVQRRRAPCCGLAAPLKVQRAHQSSPHSRVGHRPFCLLVDPCRSLHVALGEQTAPPSIHRPRAQTSLERRGPLHIAFAGTSAAQQQPRADAGSTSASTAPALIDNDFGEPRA